MNERKTIRKIIKQSKYDIKQDELVSDKEDELLQVLDENGKPTGRFEKRVPGPLSPRVFRRPAAAYCYCPYLRYQPGLYYL